MRFLILLTMIVGVAMPQEPIDSAKVLLERGSTILSHGEYAKARTELTKLIENFPDSEERIEAHFYIAESWYSEKSFEKAISEYEKVTEHPDHELAHKSIFRIGNSYMKLNLNEMALVNYWRLINLYPESHLIPLARNKIALIKKKMESK